MSKRPMGNKIEETQSITLQDFYNDLGKLPMEYQDFEMVFVLGTKAFSLKDIGINEGKMLIWLSGDRYND